MFASGAGSNFAAIADSPLARGNHYEVVGLFSDRLRAGAARLAAQRQIPAACFTPQFFDDKAAYEKAIERFVRTVRADCIALAGYMRIIGPTLLTSFDGPIVNIHPSLLPKFPGANAIFEAHDAGAATTGVTVHFVDEGIDTGPIIAQREITVDSKWSLDELTERIHRVEHDLYPRVLASLAERERV